MSKAKFLLSLIITLMVLPSSKAKDVASYVQYLMHMGALLSESRYAHNMKKINEFEEAKKSAEMAGQYVNEYGNDYSNLLRNKSKKQRDFIASAHVIAGMIGAYGNVNRGLQNNQYEKGTAAIADLTYGIAASQPDHLSRQHFFFRGLLHTAALYSRIMAHNEQYTADSTLTYAQYSMLETLFRLIEGYLANIYVFKGKRRSLALVSRLLNFAPKGFSDKGTWECDICYEKKTGRIGLCYHCGVGANICCYSCSEKHHNASGNRQCPFCRNPQRYVYVSYSEIEKMKDEKNQNSDIIPEWWARKFPSR